MVCEQHVSLLCAAVVAAALVVLATGCVEDDPCDNIGGGEAECEDDDDRPDVAVIDASRPDTCAGVPAPLPTRYVRINDLSEVDDSLNAGADIDAIFLDKRDGTQSFAMTVEGFNHGGGRVEGPELDPTEALFPPDAFGDYTEPDPTCDLEAGYVSLGGAGGYLIVGMGDAIEPGDTITVLEVGGCTGNDGAPGIVEAVEVQVSVSFELDGQWTTIGRGEGPALILSVPTLPLGPTQPTPCP